MQWEERHRRGIHVSTHTHIHMHARTHAFWLDCTFRIEKLFIKFALHPLSKLKVFLLLPSLPQYKWITDFDWLIDWFWLNWFHNKCTILCKTVKKHKLNLGNMTQSVTCSRRQGLESTKKCLLREKALCQHLFKIIVCPLRQTLPATLLYVRKRE